MRRGAVCITCLALVIIGACAVGVVVQGNQHRREAKEERR